MEDQEKKKELGKEELRMLKMMVSNWKRGYLTWLTPGDNEYVFESFMEDVLQHLSPYVERLLETKYWTLEDGGELTGHVLEELEKLKEAADGL